MTDFGKTDVTRGPLVLLATYSEAGLTRVTGSEFWAGTLAEVRKTPGVTCGYRVFPDGQEELIEWVARLPPEVAAAGLMVVVDLGSVESGTPSKFQLGAAFDRRAAPSKEEEYPDDRWQGAEFATRFAVQHPLAWSVFLYSSNVPLPADAWEWLDQPCPTMPAVTWGRVKNRVRQFHTARTEDPDLPRSVTSFLAGYRTTFDPTGFRSLLKWRLVFRSLRPPTTDGTDAQDDLIKALEPLAERITRLCVTVDEEAEFALLTAHSAYRYGRRAWVVSSYRQLEDGLWWDAEDPAAAAPGSRLLIRDLDLRFHDRPREQKQLFDIRTWPGWAETNEFEGWQTRVISSSPAVQNSRPPAGSELDRTGQATDLPVGAPGLQSAMRFVGAAKPVQSCHLVKDLRTATVSVFSRLRAPDSVLATRGRHSADTFLLRMATGLLRCAERRLDERNPAFCISAAVLAVEAYELLFGVARTTAVRALVLLSEAEVLVEARFMGTVAFADFRRRRDELRQTLRALIPEPDGHRQRTNYYVQVWSVVRGRYESTDQLDAAIRADREIVINTRWTPAFVTDGWLGSRVAELTRRLYKTECVGPVVQTLQRLIGSVVRGVKSCVVLLASSFGAWLLAYAVLVASGTALLPLAHRGHYAEGEGRRVFAQVALSCVQGQYQDGPIPLELSASPQPDPGPKKEQQQQPGQEKSPSGEMPSEKKPEKERSGDALVVTWAVLLAANYFMLAFLISILTRLLTRR